MSILAKSTRANFLQKQLCILKRYVRHRRDWFEGCYAKPLPSPFPMVSFAALQLCQRSELGRTGADAPGRVTEPIPVTALAQYRGLSPPHWSPRDL